MHAGWILALNAGSSSLKFAAFDPDGKTRIASGQVANIGPDAQLYFKGKTKVAAQDHSAALEVVLQSLGEAPAAVGHRVVHGGARNASAVITQGVLAEITQAATLAPLHNPPALRVIETMQRQQPDIPQVACFDTAFHADNSPEAVTIPIPKTLRDKGIRRYGFHGLSYASLVRKFKVTTDCELPKRLLAFHLGAGASLAAIVNGKGVATTMGFSPMDGLVMATRAGAMDAGVLLHLMRTEGMGADDLDKLLNHQSGLAAMGDGVTDMKALLETDTPTAKFAVDHYCYWVTRHAGSMIAAMQGVDGLVFTGGIGENANYIREKILDGLAWTGISENTWIIPADEEGEIAHSVCRILRG